MPGFNVIKLDLEIEYVSVCQRDGRKSVVAERKFRTNSNREIIFLRAAIRASRMRLVAVRFPAYCFSYKCSSCLIVPIRCALETSEYAEEILKSDRNVQSSLNGRQRSRTIK